MLRNIEQQITSVRMELKSLQQKVEPGMEPRHVQHVQHDKLITARNCPDVPLALKQHQKIQFQSRGTNEISRNNTRRHSHVSLPPELLRRKQAFLVGALRELDGEVGFLRAAEKHAHDLQESLKHHRKQMVEKQMTLLERRCDFLEALRELHTHDDGTSLLKNAASIQVFGDKVIKPPIASMVIKATNGDSKSLQATRKRSLTTIAPSPSMNQVTRKRNALSLTSNKTIAFSTPPLTPETSPTESDLNSSSVSALSLLGDMAARLNQASDNEDKAFIFSKSSTASSKETIRARVDKS